MVQFPHKNHLSEWNQKRVFKKKWRMTQRTYLDDSNSVMKHSGLIFMGSLPRGKGDWYFILINLWKEQKIKRRRQSWNKFRNQSAPHAWLRVLIRCSAQWREHWPCWFGHHKILRGIQQLWLRGDLKNKSISQLNSETKSSHAFCERLHVRSTSFHIYWPKSFRLTCEKREREREERGIVKRNGYLNQRIRIYIMTS